MKDRMNTAKPPIYYLDVPIMLWGWSPFDTMLIRSQFGYSRIPSLPMPPVLVAPGCFHPDQAAPSDQGPVDP